jgi:hypothetical protein
VNVTLLVYVQGLGHPGDVVWVEAEHGERLIVAGVAEKVEG